MIPDWGWLRLAWDLRVFLDSLLVSLPRFLFRVSDDGPYPVGTVAKDAVHENAFLPAALLMGALGQLEQRLGEIKGPLKMFRTLHTFPPSRSHTAIPRLVKFKRKPYAIPLLPLHPMPRPRDAENVVFGSRLISAG